MKSEATTLSTAAQSDAFSSSLMSIGKERASQPPHIILVDDDDLFRESLQRRLPAAAPFTLGNLHLLVVAVCEYLAEFQGHCAPADHDLDPRIEARVQQEIYTVLLGWLAQAEPPAGLPGGAAQPSCETAASVMSWAIFGAAIEWSRGKRTLSAESQARQMVALIVGGLSAVVLVPASQVRRIEEPAHGTRR